MSFSQEDNSFEKNAQHIAQFAVDYHNHPKKYTVTTANPPSTLFHKFEALPPNESVDFDKLMDFFKSHVMTSLTHWQHPHFHAYYPTGRSYPDMLAEFLISAVSGTGFSWDSGPAFTEMEHAMVNWLGRAMGIPESHLFQVVSILHTILIESI